MDITILFLPSDLAPNAECETRKTNFFMARTMEMALSLMYLRHWTRLSQELVMNLGLGLSFRGASE